MKTIGAEAILRLAYEHIVSANDGVFLCFRNFDSAETDIDIVDNNEIIYTSKSVHFDITDRCILIYNGTNTDPEIIYTPTREKISDKLAQIPGFLRLMFIKSVNGIIQGLIMIGGPSEGFKDIIINDQFNIIDMEYDRIKELNVSTEYFCFYAKKHSCWTSSPKEYRIKVDRHTGKIVDKRMDIKRTIYNFIQDGSLIQGRVKKYLRGGV